MLKVLIIGHIIPTNNKLPKFIKGANNLKKGPPPQPRINKYQHPQPPKNRLLNLQLNALLITDKINPV
jgi:hypothetical protein